jgi:hypothetical protein
MKKKIEKESFLKVLKKIIQVPFNSKILSNQKDFFSNLIIEYFLILQKWNTKSG